MSNIQQINHSISSFETYIKVSYQQAIDNLLSNVATQTEEDAKQIEYISNNLNTVESIIKTYVPSVSITTITQKIEPIDVYIIMENWCGSSAGNVPYIVNIMKTIKDAKIHIVPRDENEDFMNLYLSEGKKSIPIVIGFDKYGSELFKWGSFTTAQNEYAKTLQEKNIPFPDFIIAMKKWFVEYNASSIEADFMTIFNRLIPKI